MLSTTLGKGKGKATVQQTSERGFHDQLPSSPTSDSSSDSDSDSSSTSGSSSSDSDEEITPEYLESLLEKARQNAAKQLSTTPEEEEVIVLQKDDLERLPKLDPGVLPRPYFTFDKSHTSAPSIRDAEVEKLEQDSSSLYVPAPPIAPPELTKSGKALTKKERKALKTRTAGPDWFDFPAPSEADLPKMYREYEALRLRNQLDPKRFYKKEEGEGKGMKGLPKYFAIGTIAATKTPFGGPSADNLPKAARKRTIVDELVDDAETRSYAKKKFKELQTVRGANGKGTLAQKKALRRPKW